MGDCPCGSSRPFSECCGPFLSGMQHPETALGLMRSRYVAYCLKDGNYLLKTWHRRTRPGEVDFAGDDTIWLGLDILRHEAGGSADKEGRVEFVAHYLQDGVRRQLRENSRFVREANDWFYLDGEGQKKPKPGRNDPCPCGSGRKYKKCCG